MSVAMVARVAEEMKMARQPKGKKPGGEINLLHWIRGFMAYAMQFEEKDDFPAFGDPAWHALFYAMQQACSCFGHLTFAWDGRDPKCVQFRELEIGFGLMSDAISPQFKRVRLGESFFGRRSGDIICCDNVSPKGVMEKAEELGFWK